MSVTYSAVGWNRQKKRYDAILIGLILTLLTAFGMGAWYFHPEITIETFIIRGFALVAIVLLHLVLSIGPLARIDSRFLPLLYNRRHLGVLTFFMGTVHAGLSFSQFHTLGNIPARLSIFSSYAFEWEFWRAGTLAQIPFEPFGLLALGILFLMAATSHDFWLKNLGAARWKKLHLLVYFAYTSLIFHVSYGFLQSEQSALYPSLLGVGMLGLFILHGVAYGVERRRWRHTGSKTEDGFVVACRRSEMIEGRGLVVTIDKKKIALFLHDGKVRAVSNTCRHQGGPIGEGRIKDGCITCPWHGWQYQPEDGRSPPPFQEIIPTFRVSLRGDQVFIHPQEVIQ